MEKKNVSNKEKINVKETQQIRPNNKLKTISYNETPKYFKRLGQYLLKTLKEQKEKEKNIEKNINIYKKIKLIKNEKIMKEIYDNKNSNNILIKNKNNIKKYVLKKNMSYNPKDLRSKKSFEKIILNYPNVFSKSKKRKKDFINVTSNINYLLKRNQTLLMKEDNCLNINNFNFIKPNYFNHLDKNIFKENKFSSRNGMFGKKENLPLFYEFSLTHRNDYSSKSEKSRHEILLNELNKLKFYLEQNPQEELLIIKDFLQKFHIKNITNYSDEYLLKLCKLLRRLKPNQLINVIKPDNNIKKMIYNLLNISFEISRDNNDKNNYNTIYSPPSSFHKIKFNKNRTAYNFRINKKKNYFDIYDTNSKLRYLQNQKDLYKPNKNYSQNWNLLVNDLSKEVEKLEKNFKENRDIKCPKDKEDIFFVTQRKNKSFSSKRNFDKNLILSPINRFKEQNNKKGLFIIYTKNFVSHKGNNYNTNTLNVCLKKRSIIDKYINYKKDDKGKIIEEECKKNRIDTQEIAKRLYYKPTQKKFGFNDIKKNLKLTEYIVLNLAKKKLNLNRIENSK